MAVTESFGNIVQSAGVFTDPGTAGGLASRSGMHDWEPYCSVFDYEKNKFEQVHAKKVDQRPSKNVQKRQRNSARFGCTRAFARAACVA